MGKEIVSLEEMMSRAKEQFEQLSPEEREAHREEQRRSFAYGNATIGNPDVTRELVDLIADAEMRYDQYYSTLAYLQCNKPPFRAKVLLILGKYFSVNSRLRLGDVWHLLWEDLDEDDAE